MIISKDNVREAILGMSDGVEPSDAVLKAACERMAAMVKPELSEEELGRFYGNIIYGAALVALRDTSPAEIKAGDVSIKNSSQLDKITEMLNEVVEFLTPVLAGDRAVFSAVEWRRQP